MAKRLPLVFEGGEIIESKATDTTDLGNGVITAAGGDTERNLKDILGDTINVKDYGAKGDGTTDDTEAFQKAALAAAAKGGVIYVPHGTYKVTETINGEYISYGHPQFVGSSAAAMTQKLTDLYDDYVHKTKNMNETITGTKTFDASPLVPTPAATDNSQKAMNTAWLRNAVSGDTTGLSFDSNGKLKVDPSGMSPEAIKALIKSLLPGNGTDGSDGFVVDDTTGKLKVKPSELISGTGSDGLGIDGNGKIKVVPSELAGTGLAADDSTGKLSTKLKNNGGIEADSNGLYVDVNDLIPGTTTDGFEVVSGKLKVKPSEFSSDMASAVAGAGLGVKNGKLVVDFSQADTSEEVKKQLDDLMGSLHLPKWLTGSGNKADFYVDASKPVSNNVDDGVYGRTAANAWNSINYATTTIAKNYNIHAMKVYVHIAPGTYNESITLADQTRTTGFVLLAPSTQNGTVNIVRTAASGHMVDHTAGAWRLEQLNFKYNLTANTSGSSNTPAFIYDTSADTSLGIRRCNFEFAEATTGDTAISNSTNAINLRGIYCSGGKISWNNMSVSDDAFNYSSSNKANPTSTLKGSKNDSHLTVRWLYIENGGSLTFGTSDDSKNEANFTGDTPTINVTGVYTVFLHALTQAVVRSQGTGNKISFTGSPTGQKYDVDSGAVVTGLASKLPGSTDGTPTAATIPGYIS